jgi:hypothetical protein
MGQSELGSNILCVKLVLRLNSSIKFKNFDIFVFSIRMTVYSTCEDKYFSANFLDETEMRDDEDGREDAGADDHRAEQVLRGRSTC